jgi:hypothetical protein
MLMSTSKQYIILFGLFEKDMNDINKLSYNILNYNY